MMASSDLALTQDFIDDSLRRQTRVIALLDAARTAGLAPIGILHFHTMAYLANVLAPVWDMPVLEGKILKRQGGPFYPDLQRDLDRLVGLGIVTITNMGHVQDESGRWRLEGCYSLNHAFADPILRALDLFPDEAQFVSFLRELGYALATMDDSELDRASAEDATYADPVVTNGGIVDFAEWRHENYSANAAAALGELLPSGTDGTRGEKLHMYIRHLRLRTDGGR